MPKNSVEIVVFKKESSFISLWSGNELMLFSTQRSFVPSLSVSKSFPSSLMFRPEGPSQISSPLCLLSPSSVVVQEHSAGQAVASASASASKPSLVPRQVAVSTSRFYRRQAFLKTEVD